MEIKLVIFDMDGTITRPFLDFDQIRKQIGLAGTDTPILEAMQNMTLMQREHTLNVLHRHETLAAQRSTLNEGIHDTLEILRKKKIKTAILTRNLKKNVFEVMKKHRLEFDYIHDREDGPPKPDPAGIISICTHFNIEPAHCLMVGDYIHDLETAKNAGTVGVLLKTHKQALEFAQEADYAIDKMTDLINIIDNQERLNAH